MVPDFGTDGTRTDVVILRIGSYPMSHGTLGAIRTLGRLGIRVHTSVEDRFTPHRYSKYFSHNSISPLNPLSLGAAEVLQQLIATSDKLEHKPILLTTDDEGAVFISENIGELKQHYVLPESRAPLTRTLTSKEGLYNLCIEHGVKTPNSIFPTCGSELLNETPEIRFPVVLKNREAFTRLSAPAVGSTTVVNSKEQLLEFSRSWQGKSNLIVQEFIPNEGAEDWIINGYLDHVGTPLFMGCGRKLRSWPPSAGVTSCGVSLPNTKLIEETSRFCQAIKYRGVFDVDWRYDPRDGEYKMLDFNPRIGASFRMFEDNRGNDVVRVAYFHLTGDAVPPSEASSNRELRVEHTDWISNILSMGSQQKAASLKHASTEFAWFSKDDPAPFFMAMTRAMTNIGIRLPARLIWSRLKRLVDRRGSVQ